MADGILSLQDLTIRYPGTARPVIDGLSLDVMRRRPDTANGVVELMITALCREPDAWRCGASR